MGFRYLKTYILVCIVIIVTVTTGCSIHEEKKTLSEEQIIELRNQYPVYNLDHPLINKIPLSFPEIAAVADSVVIGKVIGEAPMYTLNLATNKEVASVQEHERFKGPLYASFVLYELEVERLIAGQEVPERLFIGYNSVFKGYEPELQTNMHLIVAVMKGQGGHEGRYSFTKHGTYYIVADENVLSTTDDEFAKQISGQSLDKLINAIK